MTAIPPKHPKRILVHIHSRRTEIRDSDSFLSTLAPIICRLHLIDFEQLKIENQTVNEKIEERNEELLKLRKKNTTTVQVGT